MVQAHSPDDDDGLSSTGVCRDPSVSTFARGQSASIDDDAKACGWFDSSHELRQGLWVQEHAAGDSLPAELPLADWLTLNLWSNPVTLAS
jgi:hypothetical protein